MSHIPSLFGQRNRGNQSKSTNNVYYTIHNLSTPPFPLSTEAYLNICPKKNFNELKKALAAPEKFDT